MLVTPLCMQEELRGSLPHDLVPMLQPQRCRINGTFVARAHHRREHLYGGLSLHRAAVLQVVSYGGEGPIVSPLLCNPAKGLQCLLAHTWLRVLKVPHRLSQSLLVARP